MMAEKRHDRSKAFRQKIVNEENVREGDSKPKFSGGGVAEEQEAP